MFWEIDDCCNYQEVFHRLPIPYSEEDFRIDVAQSGTLNNELGPAPYVHIKRSILQYSFIHQAVPSFMFVMLATCLNLFC